jgi:hypothetical protein
MAVRNPSEHWIGPQSIVETATRAAGDAPNAAHQKEKSENIFRMFSKETSDFIDGVARPVRRQWNSA